MATRTNNSGSAAPPALATSVRNSTLGVRDDSSLSNIRTIFISRGHVGSLASKGTSITLGSCTKARGRMDVCTGSCTNGHSSIMGLSGPCCGRPTPRGGPTATTPRDPSNARAGPPGRRGPSNSGTTAPSNNKGSSNSSGDAKRRRGASTVPRNTFAPRNAKAMRSGVDNASKRGRFCAVAASTNGIFCLIVSKGQRSGGICFLGNIARSSLVTLTRGGGNDVDVVPRRRDYGYARGYRTKGIGANYPIYGGSLGNYGKGRGPTRARGPTRPRGPGGRANDINAVLFVLTTLLTINKVNCCMGVIHPGRRTRSSTRFRSSNCNRNFSPSRTCKRPRCLSRSSFSSGSDGWNYPFEFCRDRSFFVRRVVAEHHNFHGLLTFLLYVTDVLKLLPTRTFTVSIKRATDS